MTGLKQFIPFLTASLLLFPHPVPAETHDHFSIKESAAYKEYAAHPKNEFSKLICLFDMFKGTAFKIRDDNYEYDAHFYFKTAKKDLAVGYRGQKAADIIKEYFSRGEDDKILYLKDPGGHSMPLRDFLLEELNTLTETNVT